MTMTQADRSQIREAVAARYAGLARAAQAGQMITDGDPDASPDAGCCAAPGYPDAGDLPEAAVRASLGCGNPVAVADLRPGETVLDLGSGGGIDVLLSARRVGPAGKAYGLDLSTDRPAVFAESFRVLRPGGRLGITDILAEDHLTAAQRAERGGQAGCIAGAPSFAEYRDGLARAGFTGISITAAQQAGDGVH